MTVAQVGVALVWLPSEWPCPTLPCLAMGQVSGCVPHKVFR